MYVRNGEGETARACEPSELAADGGSVAVRADTDVAMEPRGPFSPLAVSIVDNVGMRNAFARAIRVPSSVMWARMRFVALALALFPLLMLLELDRELVSKGLLGTGRLFLDVLALGYIGYELSRRTPRLPWVAAVALAAASMRWFLVAARLCGKNVHGAVWAAAALGVAAAALIAVRAPTRERLALELLDKLGISRRDAAAARRPPEVSPRTFGVVLAFTAALPLVAWQLRVHHASLTVQGAVLFALAIAAPRVVKRISGSATSEPRIDLVDTFVVIVAGLTLVSALLYGLHQFFDTGAELMRCTNRLDGAARKLIALEASEVSKRIAAIRESTPLVVLTVGIVPLVEEQIYRGLFMNVLSKRYGSGYGLFASSIVFGFTHIGVYEIALYQTVLLGIGFGMAYAEGGLVAAFVVHAMWNLLNVA